MANALIAGCGYVGLELATRLRHAGHRIWALRRRPAGLPSGIVPYPADLLDPSTLRTLPSQLDFVFYTAAADTQSAAAYRAAYVDGLRNLLKALEEQGQSPRRIFFTSSTAVYAQSNGEWVDEQSATEPSHFTGQRLLEAERLLLQCPLPSTVVRLGGIYGPGRTQTIARVRSGQAQRSAGPPVYMNHIHRDDCAGALLHLTKLDRPDTLYVGVDSAPADRGEVLLWLAETLGVPQPPIAPSAPASARGAKRCNNARLVKSGYVFQFPTYREGYGSLIEDGA